MTHPHRPRSDVFSYEGYELTHDGALTCTYKSGGEVFIERFVFASNGGEFSAPAAQAAARLLFLLAGVSYYKTTAAHVIRGPEDGLTERESAFLSEFYRSGLAEFSYQPSGVDISDLRIEAPLRQARTVEAKSRQCSPLVPFGGGIDSVVVASQTQEAFPDTALFVANTSDVLFEPIEDTAKITGLPIRRLRRYLDPKVLASKERGYFNGHVPVTGILSAAAVLSAVAHGHDRVIMSNEHSASEPTDLRTNGVAVNHQWSKSLAFEQGFRAVLGETISGVDFYSALRPYSELWVSKHFADLKDFHLAFRSCNRAFYIDEGSRLATWCGQCDKCCFIDLILSPYLSKTELQAIFRGHEPLENPALLDVFQSLLGQPGMTKPLECVGDESECRTAVRLAALRPDRADNDLLRALEQHLAELDKPVPDEHTLLDVMGEHFIPAVASR